MSTAFQAYSVHGGVTASTPKEAAILYFEKFPKSRKCDVIQGTIDGHFFTVAYGRASLGQWPTSWKEITKKTIDSLPNTTEQGA